MALFPGDSLEIRDALDVAIQVADALELDDELTVGVPTVVFETSFADRFFGFNVFDVMADAERFVVVATKTDGPGELHVVLNWLDELERLVPSN